MDTKYFFLIGENMINEDNYHLVEAQLKKIKNKDFDRLPKWVQHYLLTHKEKEYEPGFVKCKHCNGRGYDSYLKRNMNSTEHKLEWQREPCDKCDGTGQLTWLEVIFGKQHSNNDHEEHFLK